nr:hypothetical protein [Tanacetum cinerariifolium]
MSDMTTCLNDLSYIPPNNEENEPTPGDIGEKSNEPTQAKRNEFEELYDSANEELYSGCDYVTRLDFMAKFTYFKVKGKLTNSIFNEMLEFFQNVFPTSKGYKIPSSYYAIKKIFKTIGLEYESIHACVNDCFLFREDDNKDVHFCPVCKTSRWKDSNTPGKKVSKKVLRYFLIIPRLQCLYNSSYSAKEMTWHAIGKCTEPGKDINVNLRPLIDDLKDLWAKPSVETIDVAIGEKFNMSAMVLLTINYFFARSSLFGWIRQGYKACPTCNEDTPYVHVLQQYFPDEVAKPIIELCSFFMQICFATLMEDDMLKVQSNVVNILCNLELVYPPAFVDIMIHLVIHLPLEALEGGPIHPRWMYPFERFMKKLKNYVRYKAKSEGLIAKGYVGEEALTFSSHYFRDVTTKFNRLDRNVDPQLEKVIWYVLHNSPEIDTYRSQFKSKFPNKDMKEEFPYWFGSHIRQCHVDKDPGVSASRELFALVCGPTPTPISVNSYVVNGVRFVVHSRDERRITQNSRICAPGGKDGEMYYGRKVKHLVLRNNMTEIWEKDGQSMDVDGPSDIIDVDEDDDIIDDEDTLPHDLADSNDEDLVNVDDDDYKMLHGATTVTVAVMIIPLRTRHPLVAGVAYVTEFDWNDRETLMPLGNHAAHWANYLGELIRELSMHYPSWRYVPAERKARVLAKIREEMLRLQGLGSNTKTGVPYTKDEIIAIVRKGKQRKNLLSVGRLELQPEFGSGSEIGGCGDDEPSDDKDGDEDADS